MGGIALLAEARRAGLEVYANGEQLVVRGPRTLKPLAKQVLASKSAVLAALAADPDVAWRVAEMSKNLPPDSPLPCLGVRELPADTRWFLPLRRLR
jgi:hypothetical protein